VSYIIINKKDGEHMKKYDRDNCKSRSDYSGICERIDKLIEKYPFVSITSIGATVLDRRIPMISIGSGERSVLYVGGQRADEMFSADILLKFAEEYCQYISTDSRIYDRYAKQLAKARTVNIVPMLNADGTELYLYGTNSVNEVMRGALHLDNIDACVWKGNARGVDIARNYCDTYERSKDTEMESESGALRNYLLFNKNIKLVLTLMRGEIGVHHACGDRAPKGANALGNAIARTCSTPYVNDDIEGSICGFCASELAIPCFEVYSPYDGNCDSFADYIRQRQMLFLAPSMI
jgi:hypothetical protein